MHATHKEMLKSSCLITDFLQGLIAPLLTRLNLKYDLDTSAFPFESTTKLQMLSWSCDVLENVFESETLGLLTKLTYQARYQLMEDYTFQSLTCLKKLKKLRIAHAVSGTASSLLQPFLNFTRSALASSYKKRCKRFSIFSAEGQQSSWLINACLARVSIKRGDRTVVFMGWWHKLPQIRNQVTCGCLIWYLQQEQYSRHSTACRLFL